jgi:N-acetylmuramoyl-L-alanine amidase
MPKMRSVVVIIGLLFGAGLAQADSFDQLQARYLSLRNIDVSFTQESAWRVLGADLQRFVNQKPKEPNATRAILNAGIIFEELWKRGKSKGDRDLALSLYESIPRDYPGDIFADDALIRAGDVWNRTDRDESEKRYREVIEAYPDGDMVEVAQANLGELKITKKAVRNKTSLRNNLPVVIIDPGHGGDDMGARGVGGLSEKDIVLDVALRLENLAMREGFYQVQLTRRADIFVPLVDRTQMANDIKAALFISLHVNSNAVNTVSGLETYYLDNTDDKSSQALAERENKFFESGGSVSDIGFILSDLIQSSKMEDSITLANVLQQALLQRAKQEIGKVTNHGVKRAPFYVLVGTHVPGALVEMFFINNPKEEKLLSQTVMRQNLAEGLNIGIKDFLDRKDGVSFAAVKGESK